jgi:hypothetical protein
MHTWNAVFESPDNSKQEWLNYSLGNRGCKDTLEKQTKHRPTCRGFLILAAGQGNISTKDGWLSQS